MNWLVPFRTLTSVHLGLGLRIARIIAWLGFVLLILAAVMFLFGFFLGVGGDSLAAGYGGLSSISGLLLTVWALACLVLASLLAALVGIEENLRRANARHTRTPPG